MIHFICGLPGSGKTFAITKAIEQDVKEGRRALLLVPEQQTVEVERTMLKLLPPSAQLSFEVLNFSRLADKVFRVFGGLSYHYITSGIQHLLMWQTLRELSGMLTEYGVRSSTDLSLPTMMLSQISEFKACNISATRLDSACQKLPENSALVAKLKDLSLVYAAYEGMVKNSFDDSSDNLDKLDHILRDHDFFGGYRVYIDSFASFTAQEHRILRHIFKQAEAVTVSLATDSPYSDAIELSSISETARRLIVEAGDRAKITELDTLHRFTSPELARIGQALWRFEKAGETMDDIPEESRGAVSLCRCASPYAEAEAAAGKVLELLAAGYRRREIAVIARDMENYRGILDSVFEKAGIAYYLSERTDLKTKPLVSMILSALSVKVKNWRSADVIAYIKSGIPNVAPKDADLFESYVSTWNINGSLFTEDDWTMNPDGYTASLSARGTEILDAANRTRTQITQPLIRFFIALDAAENVGAMCEALRAFLEDLQAGERLKQYAARALQSGDKKEAAETAVTFRTVIRVLSDVSAALGDTEMSVEEFSCALRLVFSNTDIGTIPTAADEVLFGSASTFRTSGIRCAVLLGMCDGKFPARVAETGFLSDADRKTLDGLGITLSSNTKENAAEELLFCYRAMTLPSEKLILSYHDADTDGKASFPSLAIRRVSELLPYLKPVSYAVDEPADRLMSLPLAFEALPSLVGTPYHRPLTEILGQDEKYAPLLARCQASVSNAECRIRPEVANAVFGSHIGLTQSRLDTFVSCPLSYYGQYVLKLMGNEKANLGASGAGSFIHRILEVFMQAITDENGVRRDVEFEDIRQMVLEETERYVAELCPSRKKLSNRLTHLFKRLSRLAVAIVAKLYEEFRDSDFVPALFEAGIGPGSQLGIAAPAIELNDGSRVSIYGTIDRIDIFKSGRDVYVKVIDYKTGHKTFSFADVKKGLNCQLLLYLFSVCGSQSSLLKEKLKCEEDGQLKPAAALYVSTTVSAVKLNSQISEEQTLSLATSGIRRNGIILDDDTVINAISHKKDSALLAGITVKEESKKGDALISEEGLALLEEELRETVRNIALEMKSGCAVTCASYGDTAPCAYCKLKPLCRTGTLVANTAEDESSDNA